MRYQPLAVTLLVSLVVYAPGARAQLGPPRGDRLAVLAWGTTFASTTARTFSFQFNRTAEEEARHQPQPGGRAYTIWPSAAADLGNDSSAQNRVQCDVRFTLRAPQLALGKLSLEFAPTFTSDARLTQYFFSTTFRAKLALQTGSTAAPLVIVPSLALEPRFTTDTTKVQSVLVLSTVAAYRVGRVRVGLDARAFVNSANIAVDKANGRVSLSLDFRANNELALMAGYTIGIKDIDSRRYGALTGGLALYR